MGVANVNADTGAVWTTRLVIASEYMPTWRVCDDSVKAPFYCLIYVFEFQTLLVTI